MAFIWLLSGIVLVWYSLKAVKANPSKPNWSKAIAAALLWPLSLFMRKYD